MEEEDDFIDLSSREGRNIEHVMLKLTILVSGDAGLSFQAYTQEILLVYFFSEMAFLVNFFNIVQRNDECTVVKCIHVLVHSKLSLLTI